MKNIVNGNWSEEKAILKQKFAVLTDGNLFLLAYKKDEMIDRLQIKLGKTKEEINKLILEL
jgi:hypothetical protein